MSPSGGRQREGVTAVAVVGKTLKRSCAAAAVTASMLGLAACGSAGAGGSKLPVLQAKPQAPLVSFESLQAAPALAPGVIQVVRLKHNMPGYASPGGRLVTQVLGAYYGMPEILPVIASEPGWLEVRIFPRPNGSTAWIRDEDVVSSTTPYSIVLNLKTTHLLLYKDDRLIMSAPAGVGSPDDPTPTGHYYVTYFTSPPNNYDDYGPFIMSTSAHSDAIADWDGTGDAVIGIHGPIFDESEIGTTGAYISHGCIRLLIPDLLKLAAVPLGSPIDIID